MMVSKDGPFAPAEDGQSVTNDGTGVPNQDPLDGFAGRPKEQ